MTIAEVSDRFDLSQDTLRYYERIGLIPGVSRKKSGNRDYTEGDCKWIGFIKCMRSAGLPIEVLIEYVTLFQQGDSTHEARKELLVEQRNLLIEHINTIQKTLDLLNYKIDRYDQAMIPAENELKKAIIRK